MSSLDQMVKGALPSEKDVEPPPTTPIIKSELISTSALADPLANLPSSPPQIYLNLLILEASLRAQWLQLRTRRRQHTFFLTLLGIWVLWFTYVMFFQPREDGNGVGGSIYWAVDVAEKVCFIGGIVTMVLIWGTGIWERGMKWPRRWVYTTNRGLRVFNCKLVVIKQPLWREVLSTLSFLFSYGLISGSSGSSYRFVAHAVLKQSEPAGEKAGHKPLPNINEDDEAGHDEDLAPGGDYIKLLLLPKPFSPTFRQNWDIYRADYWEKENERRAKLRKIVQARDRKLAKERGGWLWWTGYRGQRGRGKTPDIEKSHSHHQSAVARRNSILDKDQKRTRSSSVRAGSHSRTSSRAGTPTLEAEDTLNASGHVRRGSNASNASERKRKKTASVGSKVVKLTPGSRSVTPEVRSPLAREESFNSVSSIDLDRPTTPSEGEASRSGSLRITGKRPTTRVIPNKEGNS